MAATPWLLWSAQKIWVCFSIMQISNNPVEGGRGSVKRSSSRPAIWLYESMTLRLITGVDFLTLRLYDSMTVWHTRCIFSVSFPRRIQGILCGTQDVKKVKYMFPRKTEWMISNRVSGRIWCLFVNPILFCTDSNYWRMEGNSKETQTKPI